MAKKPLKHDDAVADRKIAKEEAAKAVKGAKPGVGNGKKRG